MQPDAWQKLSATLDSLLDLSRAEQRHSLDILRRTDPDFCREVEALLGEQDTAQCFEMPPENLIDTLPVFDEDPKFDDGCAGRYAILGEIARGGMGAIYRATDAEIGRTLAVKVLLPAAKAFPDAEAWFDREARITGRLQHPGIPPVHEMSRLADSTPFFTMKLIEGRTLSEAIEDADWPSRAIGVFEQICRTLAYAHSKRIIHRDLKPGNVMVGAYGEVQVMDWGLARDLESGEGSLSGIVGTPAYMAPEQARGDADLDERCDIFGLGALLCAMITGKPPYRGETQQQTLQHAANTETEDAFQALANAGADYDLLAIARRALAANRDDRYRNASEMADAVTAYRESLAERLRQAELARETALVKVAEERRRRRVVLSLAAAVAAIVIGGLTVWGWSERLAAQKATRSLALNGQIRTALDAADAERTAMLAALADPASVNALLNDRTPWRNRLKAQASQLEQAAELAESDREILDAALEERRIDLQRTLAEDQADFQFAERADSLLIEMYEDPKIKTINLVPAFRALFADRGWNVFDEPIEALAPRMRASPIRLLALASLDDVVAFMLRGRVRETRPDVERCLAAARAIDRDDWRNRLRDPVVFFDPKQVAQLTGSPKFEAHPPQMLRFIARLRGFHKLDFISTLHTALQSYPADFWLLYSYGEATLEKNPAESMAAYRAALALRPRSVPVLMMFANACYRRQDYAASDAANRQALAIDPSSEQARYNLSVSRFEHTRTREVLAEMVQACVNDKRAEVFTAIGRHHAIFNEDAKAREFLQRAVALDAKHEKSRMNLERFDAMLKARAALADEPTRTWQEIRAKLSSALETTSPMDCVFDKPGRHRQGYRVALKAGITYRLLIECEFSPLLRIETDQFAAVVSNQVDDAEPLKQLTFTVPADGVYRIVVTTVDPGKTGSFTLRGQSSSKAPARVEKAGTLKRTDRSNNGRYLHTHKITLAAGETAIVTLTGVTFDPRLLILDKDIKLADSVPIHPFDERRTRIEIFAPTGGTFTALVTSEDLDIAGSYRLTIDTIAPWKP